MSLLLEAFLKLDRSRLLSDRTVWSVLLDWTTFSLNTHSPAEVLLCYILSYWNCISACICFTLIALICFELFLYGIVALTILCRKVCKLIDLLPRPIVASLLSKEIDDSFVLAGGLLRDWLI